MLKKLLLIISLLSFLAISVSQSFAYTVKKGDNLYRISRKFKVEVGKIKEANNLSSNIIKPGLELKIPLGQSDAKPAKIKPHTPSIHIVKKGDTLSKIARKNNIRLKDLKELNSLRSHKLRIGQRLLLASDEDESQSPIISKAEFTEEITTIAESVDMDLKEKLMLTAKKMLNIPYRFGGSTFRGMDCSAYVQYVFSLVDIFLPRSAREQFKIGELISKDELSIGDLVFFRTYASFPSHVGIYIGDNLFIHASSAGRRVTIDSLNKPYYVKRFIGAKRLLTAQNEEKTQTED